MKNTEIKCKKTVSCREKKRAVLFTLGLSAMISAILLCAEVISDALYED